MIPEEDGDQDDAWECTGGKDDLEEDAVSGRGGLPMKRPEGLLDRIRMEFLGALDDTSRSFEQVFHAFTLQEEDIDAVVRRIDKAKQQIIHGPHHSAAAAAAVATGRAGGSSSHHKKEKSRTRRK